MSVVFGVRTYVYIRFWCRSLLLLAFSTTTKKERKIYVKPFLKLNAIMIEALGVHRVGGIFIILHSLTLAKKRKSTIIFFFHTKLNFTTVRHERPMIFYFSLVLFSHSSLGSRMKKNQAFHKIFLKSPCSQTKHVEHIPSQVEHWLSHKHSCSQKNY